MSSKRYCLWIAVAAFSCAGLFCQPSAAGERKAAPAAPAGREAAQAAGAAESDMDEAMRKTSMSWQEMIRCGGWLMYVIGAFSVGALAMVIYFFAVLRASQVAPRPLQRELVEKLKAGQAVEARRACEYRACPLSAVALVALDHMRSVPQIDPALLKDVIEGEGQRQAEALHGQIQYLLDIAVIAPMAGFLGTVLGMLKAFNAVALDIAKAKPMVLASGVTQALITTVFGLLVSIPAMMFYAYFRRRASQMVSLMETAATDVLTAIVSNKTT
jgi:biopolymer transport protein ExbB